MGKEGEANGWCMGKEGEADGRVWVWIGKTDRMGSMGKREEVGRRMDKGGRDVKKKLRLVESKIGGKREEDS